MTSDVMKDYEEYRAAGRVWGQVPPERITKIKFPRIGKEIVDRFLALEDMTTSVSDALDTFGILTVVPASYIPPLAEGQRIAGSSEDAAEGGMAFLQNRKPDFKGK